MSTGQLNWRTNHSTILVRNKLYCWGGQQKDLPCVHDSEDKRKITSTVNIFELETLKWERKSTTSNPPAGVMSYVCTSIKDSVLYFGGNCKPFNCFHNNLYQLNTLTLNWNEIIATTTDNIPMRKTACGMISFDINGEDHLFLSGGIGPIPLTKQTHAQYIPSPQNPHLSYTSEIHCMNVSTSPGQWIVPVITGTRPPPLAYSTINALPGNRGVMFGGLSVNERNRCYRINDVYIFQYSHNTIDFKKIESHTTMKWPKGRQSHATSTINSISSNQQVTSHLITMGGLDDDNQPLNETWILNISSLIWYQINLPECVSKRFNHSITPYQISNNRVWIIVNGGHKQYVRSRNTNFPVTGCDVTIIVELVYTNDKWCVENIWNSEEMITNTEYLQRRMTEIQREEEVLMRDRSVPRALLPPQDQVEDLAHLRDENFTLARQLEESRQQITEIQKQANSSLKENQRILQDVMEQHQQEIKQSNTTLQETQSQLRESDTTLQETQSQLRESDTRLQETQSQLRESDTTLQETQSQLRETQSQLQQANTGAQQLQHQIQELNQHVKEINQQYQQLQQTTQRKEDIIQRQQAENQRLRTQLENPHWVIERDEVQMTQEILGTGGWGEVKVGIFRGTKVAVKSLHQMILSQYNLDLFSREMNIASRVRHPNLLQFIGATRVGNPMVLTELMPTSLRKKLEETPLTRSQILTVSSGVASALNYLHLWKPQAILHRDVSSANVLLEPSGNGRWKGKLSDYGSANLLHKTHTVAPGSIAYAAPEAQSPHLHSPAMDVFSFGILIVEMVTRRFPSGVLLEREEQIQSVQWPSIKQLAERCTINNPQLRPTIEQVLQDINKM